MPTDPPPSPPLRPRSLLSRVTERVRAWLLRAVTRAKISEKNWLFGLTLLVGAASGLAAVAFHLCISLVEKQVFERASESPGIGKYFAIVLVPAGGALLAGTLLDKFAPNARGSGIPQVKYVYAGRVGRLRFRDGVAKFILASIQIGTGSSLGREGPTVQICSTVASGMGKLFSLTPQNQRRLIPVGAAAGIAAAFNAPIAAVTFVIEELVGGLDATVLSGVVIAAALAAVVEHSILGEKPVLDAPGNYGLTHPSSLIVYVMLGVCCGALGYGFSTTLREIRKGFGRVKKVPRWAQPALGGLLTGLVAASALALVGKAGIAGGGYDVLGEALHGELPLRVVGVLCAAKFVATISSYSSGGAGGIFAPCLFVGGMFGGLFGTIDHYALGHVDTEVGAFALVGMGAFFAAVIRAPITSILIIFEMTGSYKLVLPLMVASSVAYLTARRFEPMPIYDALLADDGLSLPHPEDGAAPLNEPRPG